METFTFSQKELQRVAVISSCVKGELACARAAALLDLTPRHVKRLKARLRQAARRLWHTPAAVGPVIVACPSACGITSCNWPAPVMPASMTITFAKNWSSKKASRSAVKPSAACCAAKVSALPANVALPLIASAVCASLAKANWCNSTARLTTGSKAAARVSPLWACRTTLPAKSSSLSSFLRKPPKATFACSKACSDASACPRPSTEIAAASSSAMTITGPLRKNSPASANPPNSAAPWLNSASPSLPRNLLKPKAVSNASGACCKIACAVNCVSANACDIDSANRLLGKFIADYNRRFARTPRDAAKAWRPAPDDLQRICAFRHERIVSNDNVVQWDGRRSHILPENRRFSFAGAKI